VKACYQLPVFALGKPRSETDRSDFPASPAVFTDYLRQVTVSRNQSRIATPRHCQDTARIKTWARSSTWRGTHRRQLRGLDSSSQRQCNQYKPQIQLFDNRTLFYPCTYNTAALKAAQHTQTADSKAPQTNCGASQPVCAR
jgi:hypothetical protein